MIVEPYRVNGRLLDRYTIFGIREGGFGRVLFVADDADNAFAVKTYRPRSEEWELDAEEFRREAAFWIGLAPHPNIVRAYSVETDGHQELLFLEYIDGGARTTLREWIEAGPIEERRALEWAYGFCLGMESANAGGEIAHLDLKPDNLLVARDGTIKVADFGLAKKVRVVDGRYARATAGTWPYAAPELFTGKPAGTRSDIYAFGVILYEMLTGRLPYPFVPARTSRELYAQLAEFHARDGAHKIAESLYYGKELSEDIGSFLSACLDSFERTRSFAELRRVLEEHFPWLKRDATPRPAAMTDEELFQQAVGFHRVGRINEALGVYNRLLQRSPKTGRYWLAAAESLLANGDDETARDFLTIALRHDPQLAGAVRLLERMQP